MFRVCDAIRNVANEAHTESNFMHVGRLRCTQLRKYLATAIQVCSSILGLFLLSRFGFPLRRGVSSQSKLCCVVFSGHMVSCDCFFQLILL